MDDGDLERLRERLYRPDPPAGAVEAYRAAADVLHPQPPATEPAPRRRPPVVALLAVAALGVVGLAAVLLRPATAEPVAAASGPASPGPEFAEGLAPPQVPGTLIAARTSADPQGPIPVDADRRVVTIAVLCEVDGTLTVRLGAHETKTFLCTEDGPSLALARSDEPLGRFALSVDAAPDVVWALSVGAVEAHDGLGFAE